VSRLQCHKHMIYDRECPKCIPEPQRAAPQVKPLPPAPPPLRNPHAGHDHSAVLVRVSFMILCFAFGILVGWKMHG